MILKGLNNEIKTLEGTPILDMFKSKTMTYRSALISVCELHKPNISGTGESLKAFDLGMKFLKAEDSIELDQLELDLLMKLTNESSCFLSIVMGRLIYFLKSASEIETKVEKK